jgi:murein DD-endopeptidase MepM/ murein hydrolase activator NlpD
MNLEMAPTGDVTQWFGVNKALYAHLGMDGHNGIDLVRPHGEPMFAIEDADVVEVKDSPDGYGKHIRIVSKYPDKDGFCNEWTYGHNSENYVKVGDEVKMGQHICDMGNTGFVVSSATAGGFWPVNPYKGTHLHLGLRKVKRVRSGGFVYNAGSSVRLSVQNYNNGFYGSIDPRPLLQPLSSNASAENKRMFQSLLFIQSIINSLRK